MQCIESLNAQTFTNFEILYLDNDSSDNTYEIAISAFNELGLHYKAYRNSKASSIPHNFNFLLEKAQGNFIVPLSTDDWLVPQFLEEKMAYFEQHPDTGMLYNGGYMYFENEKRYELVDNSKFKRGKIYRELFLEDGSMFFVGCCYKREVFDKVGKWDEELLIEDKDMFIRIAKEYNIDYIDKPLVYYRKVSTSAAHNIDFMVRGWEQYYKKYRNIDGVDMKEWLSQKYADYAAIATDRNQKKTGWSLIKKSIRLAPLHLKNYRTLLYLIRKANNS